MRRRLVISTIAIVLVVLGALALPVGLIVYDAAEQQVESRLNQQAASVLNAFESALAAGREPDFNDLTDLIDDDDGLQVLWAGGGQTVQDVSPDVGSTKLATEIASDGSRIVVVTGSDPLDENVRRQLNILLVLALGGLIAAAGLAAVQAHQLARPLERLAARASRIGDGDFSRRPFLETHIPEIDHIGSAMDT
ncbi:MAG: HAMP domain-containing protein, partial [Ilumatobacter sp.]|nr:HAMP domain-containing protein [Ilumatobacter sp.]